MANEGHDLRRPDLRSNVLESPYWITSALITEAMDDKHAVLFCFPATESDFNPGYGYRTVIIHDFLFELVIADVGDTAVCTIGTGNIVDATVTITGVTVTAVDLDHYIDDGAITDWTTVGLYGPDDAGATFWLADAAANTYVDSGRCIVPDDTTPTCVVAYLSGISDPVTCAVHMLISEVPAVR